MTAVRLQSAHVPCGRTPLAKAPDSLHLQDSARSHHRQPSCLVCLQQHCRNSVVRCNIPGLPPGRVGPAQSGKCTQVTHFDGLVCLTVSQACWVVDVLHMPNAPVAWFVLDPSVQDVLVANSGSNKIIRINVSGGVSTFAGERQRRASVHDAMRMRLCMKEADMGTSSIFLGRHWVCYNVWEQRPGCQCSSFWPCLHDSPCKLWVLHVCP